MRKSTRSARKTTRSARKSTRSARKSTRSARKSTRSARKSTHKGGSGTTHYKSSQRQHVEKTELREMPKLLQDKTPKHVKGQFSITTTKGVAAPVPLCYSTGVRGGRICNY